MHRFVWLAPVLPILACSPDVSEDVASMQDGWAGDEAVVLAQRAVKENSRLINTAVAGDLPESLRQRVARPYSYLHEQYIYNEHASSQMLDGRQVTTYRVTRAENPTPATVSADSDVRLSEPLQDALAAAARGERPALLRIGVALRDFPEWDIPLAPEPTSVGVETFGTLQRARLDALADRRGLFYEMSRDVETFLATNHASQVQRLPKLGYLVAVVPASLVTELRKHPDVGALTLEEGVVDTAQWRMGDGRNSARMDLQQYHDHGFDGHRPNSARHGLGAVTVGVLEKGILLKDACFLYTGDDPDGDGDRCEPNSTSRLKQMFNCSDVDADGDRCEPTTSFPVDASDDHGTQVASIVVGDYDNGQANGRPCGDPAFPVQSCAVSADCRTSGNCVRGKCSHTEEFEDLATGMARRANLVYFGKIVFPNDFAEALDDAQDLNLDITTASIVIGFPGCHPQADSAVEREMENAFDDGVFVVQAAGNGGSPTNTCQVASPSAIPKAFTVNGYHTGSDAACLFSPHTGCLVNQDPDGDGLIDAALRGGASVVVNGTTHQGALSIIGLAAPASVRYTTENDGARGNVEEVAEFTGSSSATPNVAGAAADFKDWALAEGHTWINSPGRLHTVMLAMGDRHRGTTSPTTQNATGSDPWFGLGRLKMALFDDGAGPAGWSMHTKTFMPTTDTDTYVPWDHPMPSGIQLVKCVAMQFEDTSSDQGTISISDINLTVRIRDKNILSGGCTPGVGTVRFSRSDSGHDVKSMVAIESASVSFADKCVEVALENDFAESAGITTSTFCFYHGDSDD